MIIGKNIIYEAFFLALPYAYYETKSLNKWYFCLIIIIRLLPDISTFPCFNKFQLIAFPFSAFPFSPLFDTVFNLSSEDYQDLNLSN